MAIEYPLILPTTPGLRSVEFHARQISGMTASPFTGQQQVYEWSGEWWEADCSLPPMARAAAEEWLATLIALRGGAGTFLLGDRGGKNPRGSGAGYPAVDYDSQLGKVLKTIGWNPNVSDILKKGDYLQIVWNYEPCPRAFDDPHWVKEQCTVAANTVVAPNGVTEAERATPDSGAINAILSATDTSYPARYKGLTWFFSVWLKAASGTPNIKLYFYDPGSGFEITVDCALTTSWQRFVLSAMLPASVGILRVLIGGGNSWPESDGPIDVWGAALYCPILNARLHKVLTDCYSGPYGHGYATGNTTGVYGFDIWPRLRESPPDFSALILTDAKGTFRLREAPGWTLDEMLHYGVGFKAMEAF